MKTIFAAAYVISLAGLTTILLLINYKVKKFIDISLLGVIFIFFASIEALFNSKINYVELVLFSIIFISLYFLLYFIFDYFVYNKLINENLYSKYIFSLAIFLISMAIYQKNNSKKISPLLDNKKIDFAGSNISISYILATLTFTVLLILFAFMSKKSYLGKKLRAYLADEQTAIAYGISPIKTYLIFCMLSGILIAVIANLLPYSFISW